MSINFYCGENLNLIIALARKEEFIWTACMNEYTSEKIGIGISGWIIDYPVICSDEHK